MKLMFKDLYIFSPQDKTAKHIPFQEGINIITSNQEDGTDRGKSVIMRSLYYTLGAENYFEAKWDTKNKIYILKFIIDTQEYYLYRASNLYKMFDKNKNLLFTSIRSTDLAKKLSYYTNFAVQLPNKNTELLEITPPVYNYLPFFIDQDHYQCTTYASFKNLQMYTNYKDSVLFYHLGVYNEDYFNLLKEKEKKNEENTKLKDRYSILNAMQKDIESKIGCTVPSYDLSALEKDVNLYKKEYITLVSKLNISKTNLISLKNNLYKLEELQQEMKTLSLETEKKLKSLNKHICPECGSNLIDTVIIKSKKYNLIEDAISISNNLQINIYELKENIIKEESTYKKLLELLKFYDKKMKLNESYIEDIVKYRGLSEFRDNIVSEKDSILLKKDTIFSEIKALSKKINLYNKRKKNIEEKYYELLLNARSHFGLYEISEDKFKKLTNHFCASGSNKNISTVIWYIAILQLRKEFNNNAIEFPAVFDSPNNVETDDKKKHALLEYILKNTPTPQLILSSIGFDPLEFNLSNINLITLENPKYQLLDEETYVKYASFMEYLINAGLK